MYKIFKHNGKLIGGHDPFIEEGMKVLFEIDSNNWDEIVKKAPPDLIKELTTPEKPIATGKNLLEFIDNYSSQLSDDAVLELETKIVPFRGVLQRPRHNPLKEKALTDNVNKLLLNLNAEESKVIQWVINLWKKSVRFA